MLKKLTLIAAVMLAISLTSCNLFGGLLGTPTTPTPEATATVELIPTLPTLAPTLSFNTLAPPTLTASPTGVGGPTPLPPPTQIGAATTPTVAGSTSATQGTSSTEQAAAPTQVPVVSITEGIAIEPAVGEPGDIVMVTGKGFAPGETVTFHWNAATSGAATGPDYYSMEADGSGNFSVGLIVPKADKWPGGAPKERDLFQLRVTSPSLGFNFYFANFTYVKRFDAGTSLVLTAINSDYGYEISVPNAWTWNEDKKENYRFLNPAKAERGWVRVIETTDVNAAISQVMAAEGLTTSTSAQKTLGNFPGTEVTATNGRIVWFIPARGRVYAVSFVNDDGTFFTAVGNSLKIK